MIRKVELGSGSHNGIFGNPAPLGLLGLSVSCAAVIPFSFGYGTNVAGFTTAGIYALTFGAFCQLFAGLMDFANKNSYGGTVFTAFSFNWFINAFFFLGAGYGLKPDHHILLAVESVLLVFFLFLTYGFGFFSKLFFYFLIDIDLLYICKVIKGLSGTTILEYPIAVFSIVLMLISIWLTLASLINPVSGKEIFKIGGPVFLAHRGRRFDWTVRRKIFEILYNFWRENAFKEIPLAEFEKRLKTGMAPKNVVPELFYLLEYGALSATYSDEKKSEIQSIRLTAAGIDLYEQLILKKYEF
ncbi:MAG: hypothetical protein HQM08_13455 [Candidatus Riflebacteria bacterium]|nr:hypothetical protein [Candidatus Riflebacteria bacterium]